MKKLKQKIRALGNYVAYNTVGKSTPIFSYEPKVPQALKKQKSSTKDND